MPSDFPKFAKKIHERFSEMSRSDKLFVVDSDRDEIWQTYLGAFPPGTDPMFRKRTEHDCSCCKHFIRSVGNVVAVKDGVMSTIWDVEGLPACYQVVAEAMADYIRSCPVGGIFLTQFPKAGQEYSLETPEEGERVLRHDHFWAVIPSRFVGREPGTKIGQAQAAHDVLKRGVEELKPGDVAMVLDLIDSNAIYRGAEFRDAVASFQRLQEKVSVGSRASDMGNNDLLYWELHDAPAARLRNTAIGTLLQDLSEGKSLEHAVRSFETKVAPQNYKRPTALITARMTEDAMKTITELDLEPALERRHAKLSDVSVNSVLWVDNSVRGKMKGGIAAKLMEEVRPAPFDQSRARPITIDEFLALPHKNGIRLYVDNAMVPNFVSLTAPVHPESKSLFKWGNDFAWSYEGNVTDSIKDRVKKAGGLVEGVALRCSLAWYNTDDLDLHCVCPYGHVYFGSKRGILDVDMNIQGETREPVENMRWRNPTNGQYKFSVHNYRRREPVDVGFVVEVESALGLYTFRYEKAVKYQEYVEVCTVTALGGVVTKVEPSKNVICGQASQEVWGLKTLDLAKVNAVVLSPNYWDDNKVGNKHHFFILDGCRNPQPCRGIYNEFLHPRLEKHRKVFEVLGAKTKCPVVDEQLSGVGFSSTRKDKVYAVSGGTPYAIQF